MLFVIIQIRNCSSRTAEAYILNIQSVMRGTGNKTMEELSLQDARDFILFKRKGREAASICNFTILPKNCKNEVKIIPYMETTY